MNTGETKPQVITVSTIDLIPLNKTYSVWRDEDQSAATKLLNSSKVFDKLQDSFQKRYPWFVPQVVYWIPTRLEMWVEMTTEAA